MEEINNDDMRIRLDKYYTISSKLNYLSDNDVKQYFENNTNTIEGWGVNYIFELDENKIFMKALKVTQKEFDNRFDTSNLFNLPDFYNYGIGSCGINVWRELETHIKTTNFVLQNEFHYFPLLYHYRIVEYTTYETIKYNTDYLAYWNNNTNIQNYLDEKNKTKYKLLLFLEYIPIPLNDYIFKTKKLGYVYNKCYDIIQFMNSKNILHFDSHTGNFLVDDRDNIYITDFGLCIDKDFKLSKRESLFYNLNIKCDINNFSLSLLLHRLFDIIISKNHINHYEKHFNFIWDAKLSDYNNIVEIIRNNYEYIFKTEKINIDGLDIKKIIKIACEYSCFIDKLDQDNTKNYKNYLF